MGTQLLSRSQVARSLFERASNLLGYDLKELCREGPDSKLNATVYSQPALFVHSMACLAQWKEFQPESFTEVTASAGLSLGEYSALCASGSLSFDDGVRLVQQRGAAMQEAAESQASGMASVLGLAQEQVQQVCDQARRPGEILQVANLLCPGNIAISGHQASLEAAESLAEKAGAMKFVRLSVAGAFHTTIMHAAVDRLTAAIRATHLSPPAFPVVCNVDAQPHVSPDDFRSLLPQQVVSPVLWEGSLRNLLAMGIDKFYEVGAGKVLAGTLKRIDRKISCENIGD
jgi:[acyl-carrier-protein] S-malonyltransferase